MSYVTERKGPYYDSKIYYNGTLMNNDIKCGYDALSLKNAALIYSGENLVYKRYYDEKWYITSSYKITVEYEYTCKSESPSHGPVLNTYTYTFNKIYIDSPKPYDVIIKLLFRSNSNESHTYTIPAGETTLSETFGVGYTLDDQFISNTLPSLTSRGVELVTFDSDRSYDHVYGSYYQGPSTKEIQNNYYESTVNVTGDELDEIIGVPEK